MEQENVALAGKGKAKKGSSKGSNSQSEKKKKDLSKVKCFGCHKFGHYVSDCPERKKGKKQVAASASAEELSNRMEDEFTLIAFMVSSTSQCVWYIDSGASFHMTGFREYFSSYKEEDTNIQISMRNLSKLNPVGKGTVQFQRENGKIIPLHDVLYVPGLGMNLIFVSVLLDSGYNVLFRGTHVLIKHNDWKSLITIRVRSGRL